jgi:hypothetical protein
MKKENNHLEILIEKTLLKEDIIKGGKADGKTLEDIAVIHNVKFEDIEKEYKVGLLVEVEHSSDPEKQGEVTRDHLIENPKYYTDLINGGIVDEPKALALAQEILDIEPTKKETLTEQEDKVVDLQQCEKMSQWIINLWKEIDTMNDDGYSKLLDFIEEDYGDDVAHIIDSQFSGSKIHYHQSGRTVITGGIDTGGFIENFDEIKTAVDAKVNELNK